MAIITLYRTEKYIDHMSQMAEKINGKRRKSSVLGTVYSLIYDLAIAIYDPTSSCSLPMVTGSPSVMDGE